MKHYFTILIALFFIQLSLFAQSDSLLVDSESSIIDDDIPSDPPEKIHPFSIRISSGVPNPLSSELFRKRMIGIYEANIAFTLRTGKYFYTGIGFHNSLLSLSNRTKFNAKTKMQSYAAFLRFGYDKYHSSKIFSSIFLNLGYKKGFYTGIINLEFKPKDPNFEMYFIQPGYSINFFSEDRLTLGFYAASQFMFWKFDPDQINLLDAGVEISKFRNNGNSSFWIIGLEMYIGLGKVK